ncbi:hypothetical protein DAI22_01g363400 [Oryza sativa Japonica Group]|nr:hypothetical protein DAI22_01g363400 [Oryza sativa Japonica Group]
MSPPDSQRRTARRVEAEREALTRPPSRSQQAEEKKVAIKPIDSSFSRLPRRLRRCHRSPFVSTSRAQLTTLALVASWRGHPRPLLLLPGRRHHLPTPTRHPVSPSLGFSRIKNRCKPHFPTRATPESAIPIRRSLRPPPQESSPPASATIFSQCKQPSPCRLTCRRPSAASSSSS